MIKKYKRIKEKGITLIALIITIIILVILAVVSLNIMFGGRIIEVATNGVGNYVTEQIKEQEEFNNAVEHINTTTNKRPKIEVLKHSDRTASTMKIIAKATDGDGEKLTYKLYVGTTKENLEEQADIKENIEQGTEVSWIIPVVDETSIYYYKIVVSDKYVEIDSGVRETNKTILIGEVKLSKDLDEEKGNWIEIETSAAGGEDGKLDYTLKLWKKENEEVDESELIKGEVTKEITKEKIDAGTVVTLKIEGLEEYTEYLYRVEVSNKKETSKTQVEKVRTYCSGKR